MPVPINLNPKWGGSAKIREVKRYHVGKTVKAWQKIPDQTEPLKLASPESFHGKVRSTNNTCTETVG